MNVLGHHELDARITVDGLERFEIARWQGRFDSFASAAKRIVRQHPDDGLDILAAGAANGDRERGVHQAIPGLAHWWQSKCVGGGVDPAPQRGIAAEVKAS